LQEIILKIELLSSKDLQLSKFFMSNKYMDLTWCKMPYKLLMIKHSPKNFSYFSTAKFSCKNSPSRRVVEKFTIQLVIFRKINLKNLIPSV